MRRNPDCSRTSKLLPSCEQPGWLSSCLKQIEHQWRSCGGTPRGAPSVCRTSKNALCTEKASQIAGQVELVHAAAVRANMRSILVAMMKSFSCSPLIFLVCSETVALPQRKLIFG